MIEASSLPRTPMRFFWHFVKKMRWTFFAVAALYTFGSIMVQFQFFMISRIIAFVEENAGDREVLLSGGLKLAVWFVLLRFGAQIMWRAGGVIRSARTSEFITMIKRDLFLYVQNHSAEYLVNNLAGRLGHKINQAAGSCEHLIAIFLWGFLLSSVSLLTSSALLLTTEIFFAAFFFGWGIVYTIGTYFLIQRTKDHALRYADQQSHVSGRIIDAISNALSVKVFASLPREVTALDRTLDKENRLGRKLRFSFEYTYFFFSGMTLLQLVVMLGYGVLRLSDGSLSVAEFALIMPLSMQINGMLADLQDNLLWFYSHKGTIEDSLSQIVVDQDVRDVPSAKTLKVREGAIRFEKLDFAYGKVPVFKNLNVTIKPGEKVGLVGESGAGKTTFVHLLMRFYDVQGGQILIDGQDIARVTQSSLRKQISLIPQDTQLFHRTLLENITYGKPGAGEKEVIEAAEKAHAHEFIQVIPEGYQALVGERGIKLSGGQRQRIAIARAILEDAPILILDEATSALDSESEALIQKSLKELMARKTVIAVAHRLSTLLSMDRILVFDKGRVVEDGTHHELLRRKGTYAHLWDIQSGNFIKAA